MNTETSPTKTFRIALTIEKDALITLPWPPRDGDFARVRAFIEFLKGGFDDEPDWTEFGQPVGGQP